MHTHPLKPRTVAIELYKCCIVDFIGFIYTRKRGVYELFSIIFVIINLGMVTKTVWSAETRLNQTVEYELFTDQ